MTLAEMKTKVLAMIEELNPDSTVLTDDPDIQFKINEVMNQIQNELSRMKKLNARYTYNTTSGMVLDTKDIPLFYQLLKIPNAEYELLGGEIFFIEEGEYTIYYYKYPTRITEANETTFEFELTEDLLEIMPYGVAGDLLKSDISANYGKIYSDRYNELKQSLDPRVSEGFVYIKENEL